MKTLAQELSEIVEDANGYFAHKLDWEFKPGPEKWSGKQILGHLIDSATNNTQRFVRATHEQDFKIVYNQNEWVNYQHYHSANINDLIQLWTLLNRRIVHIWKYYPEERAGIKTDIGQSASEIKTITQVAEGYIDHLIHHLNQIVNATSTGNTDDGYQQRFSLRR